MKSHQVLALLATYEKKMEDLWILKIHAEYDGALPPEERVHPDAIEIAKKEVADSKRNLVSAIKEAFPDR